MTWGLAVRLSVGAACADPMEVAMSDGAIRPGQRLAFAELTRQIAHYNNQKSTWMYWYFSTKAIILVLGAAIPVLTTMNAWPWVIAIVGGTIAVVEGFSQLWHFHDRYVARRGCCTAGSTRSGSSTRAGPARTATTVLAIRRWHNGSLGCSTRTSRTFSARCSPPPVPRAGPRSDMRSSKPRRVHRSSVVCHLSGLMAHRSRPIWR